MNIFEALRESHENQRNLSEQLIQTHGLTEERKELFDALKMNFTPIQLPKTVTSIFL